MTWLSLGGRTWGVLFIHFFSFGFAPSGFPQKITYCVCTQMWIVSVAICLSGRGAPLVSWLQVAGQEAPWVSQAVLVHEAVHWGLRLSGCRPAAGPSHSSGAHGPAPGGLGTELSLGPAFWMFFLRSSSSSPGELQALLPGAGVPAGKGLVCRAVLCGRG